MITVKTLVRKILPKGYVTEKVENHCYSAIAGKVVAEIWPLKII